jgi:hypothetical protein
VLGDVEPRAQPPEPLLHLVGSRARRDAKRFLLPKQCIEVPIDAGSFRAVVGGRGSAKRRNAAFEFSSTEPGSTFECAIDKGTPAVCTSPFSVKVKARRKPHGFSVVAVDAAGNRDATPATYGWKVKRKRH